MLHNVKINHQGSLYPTGPTQTNHLSTQKIQQTTIQNPGDPIIQHKTSPSREKCLRRTDRLPLLFVKLLLEKSVRKVRGWVVYFCCFSRPNKYRDICDIPELSSLKFSPEIFLMKNNAQNAGEKDVNGWCMYFTKGQKRREEISLKKTTKTAHNGTIFCK